MLKTGDHSEMTYIVPVEKTVPNLYPESPEFGATPPVFATGYMVGLIEWACMRHLNPHLQEDQTSLGVEISSTHIAASTPGMTITVTVEVTSVSERRVAWKVSARDNTDVIGEGTHARGIVNREKFLRSVATKAENLGLDFPGPSL